MNCHRKIYAVAAVMLLFAVTVAVPAQETTNRPTSWAQKIEVAGVGNCFQVTTNLYRGAQPTAKGMAHLQALGVRFVISLRMLHSDGHKLHGTGLKSLNLGMVPWHADTNNLPVFVHCEHGADRTGLMCAMYRIVVCDWTKQEAIAEMENGGFHFSWHPLVSFIEKADVAEYKRRVGLPETYGTVAKRIETEKANGE
jgi:protein tyrosine phosphatase (PTP) superfamily phosphohydrolase (DUF442 family)